MDQHSLDPSAPPHSGSNDGSKVTKQKVQQKEKKAKGKNKQTNEDETVKDSASTATATSLPQNERATDAHRKAQELQQRQRQKPRQQREKKSLSAPGGDTEPCRQSKPKKRITEKGPPNAEEAPFDGAISGDENACPSPAGNMNDEIVLPSKLDAGTKGTKQIRTGGTEAGSGSVQPWRPGSKKACGGAQIDAENELPSSPADSDWEAPEAAEMTRRSPHRDEITEGIAQGASPAATSPAETVAEKGEIPPGEPATLSRAAAAIGFLQPAAGQLEVAGLFEPDDEKDVGSYDFDLGEDASLGQKDLTLANKNGPAEYELNPSGGLGIDENPQCASTNSP